MKIMVGIQLTWFLSVGVCCDAAVTHSHTYTSGGGSTTSSFTLSQLEQTKLNGCEIYDGSYPVYLRSGSLKSDTSATMVLTLSPGTITGVDFAYKYVTGYSGTAGVNFTLKVAGAAPYSSPMLTQYPCTGHGCDAGYGPPVTVAAKGLTIPVTASGNDTGVSFNFRNVDKNMQLELPMQINITCVGSEPCFTAPPPPPPIDPCAYPYNCPNKVFPRADKQTWMMNKSTIIMPCNNTGFTDPKTTLGWGIVDFDWSNSKGTGTADGWAKHSPMDDEEMLFKQVQMTAAATPGTTVWVYRCSIYAYPWYTSVRTILDDPAYAPWFVDFKPEGPWHSSKCDNNFKPPKCSNHYHMQEQTPGFPHGDGDCAAPGCDCGDVPCGFYLWNHSSTAVVHNQTFQQWFINDYMLNKVGMSPLVSGFFWDDFWPHPGSGFPDSVGKVAEDTGLDQDFAQWGSITQAYQRNMDVLRTATLSAGKFAWQLMWTGGDERGVGGTIPHAIVSQGSCASTLRSMCSETAPPQTRAMMYAINCHRPNVMPDVQQDLANFLLIRGPYAWLGHGWKGCSQDYPFPDDFNADYGEPVDKVCKETAPETGIFTREWSKATVQMDCKTWTPTITMK